MVSTSPVLPTPRPASCGLRPSQSSKGARAAQGLCIEENRPADVLFSNCSPVSSVVLHKCIVVDSRWGERIVSGRHVTAGVEPMEHATNLKLETVLN